VTEVVLDILGWSLVASAASWFVTLLWANAAFKRHREDSQDELAYWQREAVKARELVIQLRQERAVWARGCKQGREDVIAIMPLLVAAQQTRSGASVPDVTETQI
jgi:hypothetical protein